MSGNWNRNLKKACNARPAIPARRSFLKRGAGLLALLISAAAGWLHPRRSFAARNNAAFAAATEADALADLFPGRTPVDSAAIHIDVEDEVENGAVVPLAVTADLPGVESITLLVAKNPNPLIAKFNLGPECEGFIATRIKVGEPSDIIAVVESGGKLYRASKFVKVIIGGCG